MALVETIVSLARTLDLAVVAEGIELDGTARPSSKWVVLLARNISSPSRYCR
jgi:sensor c-di-GMP phosphodiesterase-like protein